MELFAISFFILMSIIIIASFRANNKSSLDMRKNQSSASLREHAIKKALEENFESSAKYVQKYKVEKLCIQAGLKIKYGEFMLMRLVCAILLPLVLYAILKNEFLTIIAIPLGTTIPTQIITVIRNRRMNILNKQVGSFLQIVTERYSNTKDFAKSINDCTEDFRGAEPFYSELRETTLEMELGVSPSVAIKNLAKRTGNKYLNRLGDYYALALRLGTADARNILLRQAFLQYEDNENLKNELKMAISGPVNEAYIMIAFIPATMVYAAFSMDGYIEFMTTHLYGKIGVAWIFLVVFGCLWVVGTKISAPIDE